MPTDLLVTIPTGWGADVCNCPDFLGGEIVYTFQYANATVCWWSYTGPEAPECHIRAGIGIYHSGVTHSFRGGFAIYSTYAPPNNAYYSSSYQGPIWDDNVECFGDGWGDYWDGDKCRMDYVSEGHVPPWVNTCSGTMSADPLYVEVL